MKISAMGLLFSLYLSLVSGLCIGLYLTPADAQKSLMAYSGDWSLLKFYSSTFIHMDLKHLTLNLISFLGVGVFLYTLSLRLGRERRLLASLVLAVLVLPLISNASFFLIADLFKAKIVSSGLSGVVSSLVGMIVPMMCIIVGKFLKSKRSIRSLYTSLILLSGSAITYPYTRALVFAFIIFIVALVSGLLMLVNPLREILDFAKEDQRASVKVASTIFMILAYFATLIMLFPSNISAPGGYSVNIFSHSVGVFYGIISGAYTLRMLPKKE